MTVTNPAQKMLLGAAASTLASVGPALARVGPIRRAAVGRVDRWLLDGVKESRVTGKYPPGVADNRALIGQALLHTAERVLVERRASPAAQHALFKVLVQGLLFEQGDHAAAERFRAEHGHAAPTFMVISPGKACNLSCTGCYADSGAACEKLEWATFERIVDKARTLWGTRFFVISGGEPMVYRSAGKGILDMAEAHPDCLFLMFTNGTLINEHLATRLAQIGNLFPAISLEGWRSRTDARRGPGTYDKILATMDRLRRVKVPYGVSLTATRHNAEEILGQDFVDCFFKDMGALFGFMFHYMPIGRSFTLDLMPTPEQRIAMWHRSWEIIRENHYFLVDFWNHGTACDGCLSAGGHGAGGYMYVDWNGSVSPCVFLPYTPVNVKEMYAHGGTLADVWSEPFFGALRGWQAEYRQANGNGLAPCPIRDHHSDLRRLLAEFEPDPADDNARAALLDPEYPRGLDTYDRAYQALADRIWQQHYLRPADPHDGHIEPLPDLTRIMESTAPIAERDRR